MRNQIKRILAGLFVFTLLVASLPMSASATSNGNETGSYNSAQASICHFTDVSDDDWFYENVCYVVNRGIMNGITLSTFAPGNYVTRATFVETLFRLCGSPEVNAEPNIVDVNDDAWYAEAVDWAVTYGITNGTKANTFSPDDYITRQQAAAMIYAYTEYKCYDIGESTSLSDFSDEKAVAVYARDAMEWAMAAGIFEIEDGQINPTGKISRAQLAGILTQFEGLNLQRRQNNSETITLDYPSEAQMTICQKRDFYVIGHFNDGVDISDDAVCEINLTPVKSNTPVRTVVATQKDFKKGMYVDYDKLEYDGDREDFRNAGMPDLVYDGEDVESFKNTWLKCYFNDDVFTSVIYGGTYQQDINPYDQNGDLLEELPEGNYQLSVTVSDQSGVKVAEYVDTITIGTIPDKVLSRFSPDEHFENVKEFAEKYGLVCFTDPFPGYWNTQMFLPDWGVDYEAEITRRWSLADRQEYMTGHIHYFDYNITRSSTSYSVELGQLAYQHDLVDPDRLTTYYYDLGEPSLPAVGSGQFVAMDSVPTSEDEQSLYITRIDYDSPTGNNVINIADLKNIESTTDLSGVFEVEVGHNIAINGVCNISVPDSVQFNPDNETFSIDNQIVKIRIESENYPEYFQEEEIDVGLQRISEDGYISQALCEFKYNFISNMFYKQLDDPLVLVFVPLNSDGEQIGHGTSIQVRCVRK